MLPNLWEIKEKEKICAIDIDGVLLSSYPQCWIDFINKKKQFGKTLYGVEKFIDLNEMKRTIPYQDYKMFKEEYRVCRIKEKLKPDKYASEITNYLSSKGYTIVIITARPANKYLTLYNQTINWLKNNNIKYDYIFFGEKDKHAKILCELPHIKFVIEDNSYVANSISKWGYKVFLLNNKYNENVKLDKNVIRIYKLNELKKYIT